APTPGRDGVCERFRKAGQRRLGIPTIEREVSETVQRARQLLVETELSCTPHRLLEHPLTLVEVSAVAVRVTQPVELVQEQGLGAGLLEQRQGLLVVGDSAIEVAPAPRDARQP